MLLPHEVRPLRGTSWASSHGYSCSAAGRDTCVAVASRNDVAKMGKVDAGAALRRGQHRVAGQEHEGGVVVHPARRDPALLRQRHADGVRVERQGQPLGSDINWRGVAREYYDSEVREKISMPILDDNFAWHLAETK